MPPDICYWQELQFVRLVLRLAIAPHAAKIQNLVPPVNPDTYLLINHLVKPVLLSATAPNVTKLLINAFLALLAIM